MSFSSLKLLLGELQCLLVYPDHFLNKDFVFHSQHTIIYEFIKITSIKKILCWYITSYIYLNMQKYLNKITLSINSNVNFSRYYLYYYLLNHIDKRIFVVGNLSFFCLCDNRQYVLYIITILKFALIHTNSSNRWEYRQHSTFPN